MARSSIYGLYDAEGNLRYIGKANDPRKRLKAHLREVRRRRTPLYDWLRKHGVPELRVLESDCADWKESEMRLIAEARARDDRLLNLADGGDEPFCSTEQRSANAKALNHAMAKDPKRYRLREMKRMLVTANRLGYLREDTKEKLRDAYLRRPDIFGFFASI